MRAIPAMRTRARASFVMVVILGKSRGEIEKSFGWEIELKKRVMGSEGFGLDLRRGRLPVVSG